MSNLHVKEKSFRKRRLSYTSQSEKISERSKAEENNFFTKLRTICFENYVTDIPLVRSGVTKKTHTKESTVSIDSKIDPSINEVIVYFLNNDGKTIKNLQCKLMSEQALILSCLLSSLEHCNSIKKLNLQNCYLKADSVEVLQTILKSHPTISDLNLNGNAIEEQNYHLLIDDTNLINLSLRFCKIDKIGISNLAKILCEPYKSKLLCLNLSSNLIEDEGSLEIGKILRINRTIISLNLADNKITDLGCKYIMQSLQKFALVMDEIKIRRSINLQYYKDLLIANAMLEKNPSLLSTKSSKDFKMSSKQSLSGSKSRRKSKEKTSVSSISSSNTNKSKTSKIILPTVVKENHPFVNDSYEENFEIYCTGNNTLQYLNLSFNKIKKVGLTDIIEMLKYQKAQFGAKTGIKYGVLVQGNMFDNDCEQVKELAEIIQKKNNPSETSLSKLGSRESFINSKRKRLNGSSKVSVN